MKNLWAPWRMEFVSSDYETRGCFLCAAGATEPGEAVDLEHLIIARGKHCFCMLNKFPYSNGHILVSPYEHVDNLDALDDAAMLEMMRLACIARQALETSVNAQGFNLGLNLGRDAGAGVADHLHLHVVPRWRGDTNFLPVISETKVIPQALHDVWEKLRAVWPAGQKRKGGAQRDA